MTSQETPRFPKPAAILFDGDGTLIDTYQIILQSMTQTINGTYGLNLSVKELTQGIGTPLYNQMLTFAKGDEDLAREMVDVYQAHNVTIHDELVAAYPGTAQALARLSAAGIPLAEVTSKSHKLARHGLELSGISEYIGVLVGADDWPVHKPEAGPVLRGCELLGVDPQECWYVGDSPYDIMSGSAAGCKTAACLWGMFPEDVIAPLNPTVMCASMGDFADLFDIA
jgi:pyrophosphatase PpaX